MPQKEIITLYRIYDINNEEYLPLNNWGYKDDYRWYFINWDWLVCKVEVNFYTDIHILENQDDYIIERCSWLKDKNKQWIYEGDRLKTYQILASDAIDSKSFIVAVERVWWYFISNGSLNSYQADISEIIWTIHE